VKVELLQKKHNGVGQKITDQPKTEGPSAYLPQWVCLHKQLHGLVTFFRRGDSKSGKKGHGKE